MQKTVYHQSIKDWPEGDRPRERLIKHGSDALTDAELLAIILRTGANGKSALDHARQLISDYGGFQNLADATIAELCKTKGIGKAKACQIKAALEIARRTKTREFKEGERFINSSSVYEHFSGLRDKKKETFIALLLDGKNKKIKEVRISEGSLTASIVHPREVFNPVIRDSAASVIFVHNHPSGDPSPSKEDIEITKRLKQVAELIGVRVIDHIIIGGNGYTSFADTGML